MLIILNHTCLARQKLPSDVERQVHIELQKILALSGGKIIDNEFGSVFVLTEDDDNASVESTLSHPLSLLLFEGMIFRDGCYVGYLSGGGNECLDVLICPERYLSSAWKSILQAEL